MDKEQLKSYIDENDLYYNVLEFLDCHTIQESTKDFIRCSLDNKNNNSIGLQRKTFKVKDFSNMGLSGDIFSLIMDVKNVNFSESIKLLHNLFNLKYTKYTQEKKESYKDPFCIFKKIRRKSKGFDEIDEMKKYSDNIINNWIPYLHTSWSCDMLEKTRKKFDIGFSIRDQRITIPHRHYETGDLIGVVGRTVNELQEELNIPKYFPLIKYPKSRNLYGLFQNYKHIQNLGYITVFEGEKSVHKRDARFDYSCVSIGCHEISNEQVKILKELNVEIIIAFDKDVSLFDILKNCEKFYPIKNVSFIYDKNNILSDKDSPADSNLGNYKNLFDNRIKYTEKIHNKFLEMKERKISNGKKRCRVS